MNDIKFSLPQNIAIAGATNSGKTYFLTTELLPALKGQYDTLVVLCPTLHLFNTDYQEYESDDKSIFHIHKKIPDALQEVIQTQKNFFKQVKDGFLEKSDIPRILIILDDCISIPGIDRILNKTLIKSRHLLISFIIISQRICAISRQSRLQMSHFFLFSSTSFTELERILTEYVPKKYHKGFQDKLIQVYHEQYNYVYINNRENNPLRRVFDKYGECLIKN